MKHKCERMPECGCMLIIVDHLGQMRCAYCNEPLKIEGIFTKEELEYKKREGDAK